MRLIPLTQPLSPLMSLDWEIIKALALFIKGNAIDYLLPHARDGSPVVLNALMGIPSHLHVVKRLLQLSGVHRLVIYKLLPRGRCTLLLLWRGEPV